MIKWKTEAHSFERRGFLVKLSCHLLQASQEVPEWLDEIAESAVGTSYGPAGGRFASRDTRRQVLPYCCCSLMSVSLAV